MQCDGVINWGKKKRRLLCIFLHMVIDAHFLGYCFFQDRDSYWKMMHKYIGSDVTSMVTLPVMIFEPLTILQRMAEVFSFLCFNCIAVMLGLLKAVQLIECY